MGFRSIIIIVAPCGMMIVDASFPKKEKEAVETSIELNRHRHPQ